MNPLDCTPDEILAWDARVRQLAVAVAGDGLTVDDVAQEAWVRALQAEGTAAGDRTKGVGWFATVMQNAARNLRRTEARRLKRERAVARPELDAASGPFDLAAYEERRTELVSAVESLPAAQRDVLVARYWEGLEPVEIARRTGQSADAVRQRMRRALAGLRERIDRESGDSRRMWLLPLLVGNPSRQAAVTAATAAGGSTVVIGGIAMKKTMTIGIGLVLLVGAGVGLAQLKTDAGGVPSETRTNEAASARLQSLPAAEHDARGGLVDAGEREELEVVTNHATQPRLQLLDAEGAPIADAAFWVDEKPFPGHPVRVPESALRTGPDGRFDLATEELVDGDFLWCEIDEGLSVAVACDSLGKSPSVRVPPRREVKVEILGLPVGSTWRIETSPAWDMSDGAGNYGGRHIEQLHPAGSSVAMWIARSAVRVEGAGPAVAEFHLVDGLRAAFSCGSSQFEVTPHVQELVAPDFVVAHAGGPRDVFAVEVVEADRSTRSDMGGRILLYHASESGSYGIMFEDGAAELGRLRSSESDGVWLVVVMRDGETFCVRPNQVVRGAGEPIRFVRGTGKRATLRLKLHHSMKGGWDIARAELGVDRSKLVADPIDEYAPVPDDDEESVGAWIYDGYLVVQAEAPKAKIGELILSTSDGRVAERRGRRVLPTPMTAMEPLDPRALIERYAEPVGSKYLMVRLQIESVAADWTSIKDFRFYNVDGFGWRFSPRGSNYSHEPLQERIGMVAPKKLRSRLQGRVRSGDWFDLPLRRRQ